MPVKIGSVSPVDDHQAGKVIGQEDLVAGDAHTGYTGFLQHAGALIGQDAGWQGVGFIGTIDRDCRKIAEERRIEKAGGSGVGKTGNVNSHHTAERIGDIGDGAASLDCYVDILSFVVPLADSFEVGPGS